MAGVFKKFACTHCSRYSVFSRLHAQLIHLFFLFTNNQMTFARLIKYLCCLTWSCLTNIRRCSGKTHAMHPSVPLPEDLPGRQTSCMIRWYACAFVFVFASTAPQSPRLSSLSLSNGQSVCLFPGQSVCQWSAFTAHRVICVFSVCVCTVMSECVPRTNSMIVAFRTILPNQSIRFYLTHRPLNPIR